MTSGGREFRVRDEAAGKARSPIVGRRVDAVASHGHQCCQCQEGTLNFFLISQAHNYKHIKDGDWVQVMNYDTDRTTE